MKRNRGKLEISKKRCWRVKIHKERPYLLEGLEEA
jgi:hypothetical protein